MHVYTNFEYLRSYFTSAKASSAVSANMKVAVIFFGTLATAILLAEAFVSEYNL